MDKKVISYIKENLLKGHSVVDIKKHLIIHGHDEKDIDKVISKISKDYEENRIHP